MPEQDHTCTAYANFNNLPYAEGIIGTSALLRWKCHKEVNAVKITNIIDPTLPGEESTGSRILVPEVGDIPLRNIAVDHDYVRKHKPEIGGYYVVYEDGYESFSPAKAFEDGYTRF